MPDCPHVGQQVLTDGQQGGGGHRERFPLRVRLEAAPWCSRIATATAKGRQQGGGGMGTITWAFDELHLLHDVSQVRNQGHVVV